MTDIKDVVESMELAKGTSKSGTAYFYINIKLINGGEERIFLNSDSKFKWEHAIGMLED